MIYERAHKTRVHHWERATPILSVSHGSFTDRSTFRLRLPRKRSVPVYIGERASVRQKWQPQVDLST